METSRDLIEFGAVSCIARRLVDERGQGRKWAIGVDRISPKWMAMYVAKVLFAKDVDNPIL